MNKRLLVAVAALAPLVGLVSSANAVMNYQGVGGWRTSDGRGGWVQNDDADNRFDIGIDACKQTCEEDANCRGIEYVSSHDGWGEDSRWVQNKCEIHRDPYTHCDQNGGGRGSEDDGCWIKQAPDMVGGNGGQPPQGDPPGNTGQDGVAAPPPIVAVPWYPPIITAVRLGVNDTGITKCASNDSNNVECNPASWTDPQQDAMHGRDAYANNGDDGHAGFNFTKIGSDGQVLPKNATSWDCVRDNVTGLMWENKTENGMRAAEHSYTWYEPNTTKNGGNAGKRQGRPGPTCGLPNLIPPDNTLSYCNTNHYVRAVNAAGLCGARDWRMPTLNELNSLVDFSRRGPTIDVDYFNPTANSFHWSSSTVPNQREGWGASAVGGIGFADGYSGATPKVNHNETQKAVRLVRGG